MKKMKFAFSLLIAASMSAFTGCASSEYAYDSWDYDSNAYLDTNEFNSAVADIGYYDNWDTDSDGLLTEDEWNLGVNEYFDDYDTYGTFSDWDTDLDGQIGVDEFGTGLYGVVDENDNDIIEENEYDTWYDDDFGL